jgi:hypothetical protein
MAPIRTAGSFEDDVLEMCSDDYEAPHTIANDLARDLGRPVTHSDVRAALLLLAAKGLVQAYEFDAADKDYVPISAAAAEDVTGAWFRRSKR